MNITLLVVLYISGVAVASGCTFYLGLETAEKFPFVLFAVCVFAALLSWIVPVVILAVLVFLGIGYASYHLCGLVVGVIAAITSY